MTDWTQESGALPAQVAINQPRGQTALYDAVYLGLEKMKEAKNERKALILITDGEDNSSRYSPRNSKNLPGNRMPRSMRSGNRDCSVTEGSTSKISWK